jgi:H+-translocating NAD(P) transhydrogenase subunit alpha
MPSKLKLWLLLTALLAGLAANAFAQTTPAPTPAAKPAALPQPPVDTALKGTTEPKIDEAAEKAESLDFMSMVFVFMLATFIGIGVIIRVSRLLHTPLMSLTNAISAIAVVGSIIVAGGQDHPTTIRVLGAVALCASMTNIISGFLITDRMLKMFKTRPGGKA